MGRRHSDAASIEGSGSFRQADVALVGQMIAVRVFEPSACSVVMFIAIICGAPR